MHAIFDSFWRAVAYCLHPRVLLWSLLPLLLAGAAVGGLGWAYWESAVAAVRSALEQTELVAAMLDWLDSIGANRLRAVMAPMIVVALSVPLVVLATLLLVAVLVTPAVVNTVAARRFPALQRCEGCGWWQALGWSLCCTAAALAALAVSVPLWFVPPLVLVLPPLIWGWLTGRVFAYEALASHASADERRYLLRQRRWPLLLMGVACGYLGALPSLVWAVGAAALIFAPVLALVSVWLYTVVFVFAACWFTHYMLFELQGLRSQAAPPPKLLLPEASEP
jgi:Etoposide-induced protein 2.4 (EI24)